MYNREEEVENSNLETQGEENEGLLGVSEGPVNARRVTLERVSSKAKEDSSSDISTCQSQLARRIH